MTKITPEQIEEVRELLARATPCHVALPNKTEKEANVCCREKENGKTQESVRTA